MKTNIQPLKYTVSLALEAHSIAEKCLQKHSNPKKAKQVYLNALAIYAVDYYLRCLGYETNWKASDSVNLVMQTLMDVADLVVTKYGKIECRPVLPGSKVICVPQEVWSERIGYIAVQLDESLREATLLGFLEKVEMEEIPLNQLQSLDDFPTYFNRFRQASQKKPIQLKQWFQNIFEAGWQTLDLDALSKTLSGSELGSLASVIRVLPLRKEREVKGVKLIDLGAKLGNQSIALLVAFAIVEHDKQSIRVQVHPASGETYLPPNVKLALLSDSGAIIEEVPSRNLDNFIQLPRFKGSTGDTFSIKVSLEDFSLTEEFVI